MECSERRNAYRHNRRSHHSLRSTHHRSSHCHSSHNHHLHSNRNHRSPRSRRTRNHRILRNPRRSCRNLHSILHHIHPHHSPACSHNRRRLHSHTLHSHHSHHTHQTSCRSRCSLHCIRRSLHSLHSLQSSLLHTHHSTLPSCAYWTWSLSESRKPAPCRSWGRFHTRMILECQFQETSHLGTAPQTLSCERRPSCHPRCL
mmetsp:Transcript_25804/g.56123  ORF Transcript_25804/g.56123 Transcript_25804/m.56123 type:complete len:201 (-) Transcript_25804:432-1034(-)